MWGQGKFIMKGLSFCQSISSSWEYLLAQQLLQALRGIKFQCLEDLERLLEVQWEGHILRLDSTSRFLDFGFFYFFILVFCFRKYFPRWDTWKLVYDVEDWPILCQSVLSFKECTWFVHIPSNVKAYHRQ